jgi:hypothetical protein
MHSNWPENNLKTFYKQNNKQQKKKHSYTAKECFVYQLWFPEIDSYYVGMTNSPKRREQQHKENISSTIHEHVNKFKYEFDVLYKFSDALWAAAAEIEQIAILRSLKLNVLNKTRGGEFPWSKAEGKIVNEMLGNSHTQPLFLRDKAKKKKEKLSDKKHRQKVSSQYWKDRQRKQEFFVPKSNEEWKSLAGTKDSSSLVCSDVMIQSAAIPFSYKNIKPIRSAVSGSVS